MNPLECQQLGLQSGQQSGQQLGVIGAIIIICVSVFKPVIAAETQVFKCQQDNGKRIYQSKPCGNNQTQQLLNIDISNKGAEFANEQQIKQSSQINAEDIEKDSPYYYQFHSLKQHLATAEQDCDNAKTKMISVIARIKAQCEAKRNGFCREAEAASLAGNYDRQTWGAKNGWTAYRDLNDAKGTIRRYCDLVVYYENRLNSLRKTIAAKQHNSP